MGIGLYFRREYLIGGYCASFSYYSYIQCRIFSSTLSEIYLKQIDEEVEVICIDDGSSDNSGKICDEIAKEYDCLKVYHKPNGGVSSARNLALSYAHGTYIAWVDSDDYVADNWYQSLKPLMESGIDLILFEHYRVESSTQKRVRYCKESMLIDKSILCMTWC